MTISRLSVGCVALICTASQAPIVVFLIPHQTFDNHILSKITFVCRLPETMFTLKGRAFENKIHKAQDNDDPILGYLLHAGSVKKHCFANAT